MAVVDWTDPCARATALREAYFGVVAGLEQSVRIRNGEHEREVTYAKADLTLLRSELKAAEAECAELSGITTGRRYAIRGGSRRGY